MKTMGNIRWSFLVLTLLAVSSLASSSAVARENRPETGSRPIGGSVSPERLYGEFREPPQEMKPWAYWLWLNTLTDRETLSRDAADIAKLGFGGVLVTDSRGYWDDEEHVVVPKARIRWGSDEWQEIVAHAIRECARNGLVFSINVAASGGHLRGGTDAGGDNPKYLLYRRYRPGEPFERPASPHYRDVAVFAVRTAEPVPPCGWTAAGDGIVSTAASQSTRTDSAGKAGFVALESRELASAADGAALDGNWTILRFGSDVIPGRPEDVDVLDPLAVRRHLDRVFGAVIEKVPGLYGQDRCFRNLYNVSWEGMMPTWSPTFEDDFSRFEGYALRPHLPALAGFATGGKSVDAVMRDFRHGRGRMMVANFYGTVRAWAHEHGLRAFSESGGPWPRAPESFGEFDQQEFLAANDFPQGEFWPLWENFTDPSCGHANANGRFVVKGVASAAHAFGVRISSAEAFTHMVRHWSVDPAFLKPIGDQAFADGINRMVWHTYTTAPDGFGTPGLEFFAGSHINRHVTWHDELAPFVRYLSRCQCLLQRGEPVTDVAVLVGDRGYLGWGVPENGRLRNVVPGNPDVEIPKGHAYDAISDLAVGKVPGLLDRYAMVIDARGERPVRRGTLPPPDVETDSDWTWCHRRTACADVYFVVGEGRAGLTFRASSESVEVWDAVTGCRTPAKAERRADGRTCVSLELPKGGSCFVLFLKTPLAAEAGLPVREGAVSEVRIPGPWDVSFAYHPGLSATPPSSVRLSELVDFTTREDLRHFAGTATYRTTFGLGAASPCVRLSLGEVPSGLARVLVNGRDCGTAWCAPWEVDVSAAVKPGKNELEIRYVNNWCNLLAGECHKAASDRIVRTAIRFWEKPRSEGIRRQWASRPTVYSGYAVGDPLQPSGLLGPITLRIGEPEVLTASVDLSRSQGPVKPLHGVNDAPYRLNGRQGEFAAAGIPYVRTHDIKSPGVGRIVDIPDVFPDFDADEDDPASYDFAFTDAWLKPLVEAGCRPFYRLGVTIENNWKIKAYHIHPPKDYAKWARICEHVVRHYNEGWANGYRWNVEYWEIWNEPENPAMWSGTKEEFFELYRVVSNHLKTRFPDIRIGGYASCGFYAVDDKSEKMRKNAFYQGFVGWFEDFCRYVQDPRTRSPLDFFSWHLYVYQGTSIERIRTHARYVRQTLDAAGLGKAESVFNEWNVFPKIPKVNYWDAVKTHQAAALVAASFCLMQEAPVDKAMYYRACPDKQRCGLFYYPSEKTTPCYEAFRAWNELAKLGQSVGSSVEGSEAKSVYVSAATDGRNCAVLLANIGEKDRIVRVKGLQTGGLSLFRVDADHPRLKASGRWEAGGTLALPAHGIVLLASPAEGLGGDRRQSPQETITAEKVNGLAN